MATPGLILDRDGTVTEERGYVTSADGIVVLPGVVEALARARAAGWKLVLVTNQSAVGRGLVTAEVLDAMLESLRLQLGLDAVYYCPHLPGGGCRCRKPMPGMIEDAVADLDLDVRRTVLVGDNITDVDAALAAGIGAVLVRTGHGVAHVDAAAERGVPVVDDLSAAIDKVLGDG